MEEQIWPSAERFRRVSIMRSPEFVSHGGLLRALSTQRPAFVDRYGDTGKTGGANLLLEWLRPASTAYSRQKPPWVAGGCGHQSVIGVGAQQAYRHSPMHVW